MTEQDVDDAPEVSTKGRLSFSNAVENLQIAWDSTSIGALKRCPRYYEYNILRGYSSRGESAHLRFGIEYNNALVTYHKARASGVTYDVAVLLALRYALEHTWDDTLGRPWTSDEPTKNRETLIRSVLWHLEQFAEDPFETVITTEGKPAVEVSFRLEIGEFAFTGEAYMLCGYLDRQINFVDSLWYTDYKTTKGQLDEKYFAQYTPNNQISQYSFAGNIISPKPIQGIFIDAAQVGVTFTRFHRSRIHRTPDQLEEWARDSLYYIRQNEEFVQRDYWPQNDTACNQYGGCPFRPVCALTPSLRAQHLKMLFHRRVWDPLVEREI
jgi:hypothetical protein